MKIAEKFSHPIFTFLDLAGANPGIGAEERGQGEAIARNLIEMSRLRVPTIATVTGEGGSGGALALAVADRVIRAVQALPAVDGQPVSGSAGVARFPLDGSSADELFARALDALELARSGGRGGVASAPAAS